MKKIIFTILILAFIVPAIFAQRIIVNQNFETTGFNLDSLPPNWVKENVDPTGGPGMNWAVRDTGTHYIGTNTILVAQAHDSRRALTIPWTAGNPIADDWVFTDTFTIQTGDSLIFWMLIGSVPPFAAFLDTMQVWTAYDQSSALQDIKLATFKSNDSAGVPLANNVWTKYILPLSAFAGQTRCIAFRYFMNTSVDGFWCNIDDVFIGNRASVGISQIGSNIPKKFALSQNFPNPFNPTTRIKFDIPKNTVAKLEIYNNIGQLVKILHDGQTNAGYYETTFDGSSLSSGIYYYRLTSPEFVETKRMIP